jgi:hypothetical protein
VLDNATVIFVPVPAQTVDDCAATVRLAGALMVTVVVTVLLQNPSVKVYLTVYVPGVLVAGVI